MKTSHASRILRGAGLLVQICLCLALLSCGENDQAGRSSQPSGGGVIDGRPRLTVNSPPGWLMGTYALEGGGPGQLMTSGPNGKNICYLVSSDWTSMKGHDRDENAFSFSPTGDYITGATFVEYEGTVPGYVVMTTVTEGPNPIPSGGTPILQSYVEIFIDSDGDATIEAAEPHHTIPLSDDGKPVAICTGEHGVAVMDRGGLGQDGMIVFLEDTDSDSVPDALASSTFLAIDKDAGSLRAASTIMLTSSSSVLIGRHSGRPDAFGGWTHKAEDTNSDGVADSVTTVDYSREPKPIFKMVPLVGASAVWVWSPAAETLEVLDDADNVLATASVPAKERTRIVLNRAITSADELSLTISGSGETSDQMRARNDQFPFPIKASVSKLSVTGGTISVYGEFFTNTCEAKIVYAGSHSVAATYSYVSSSEATVTVPDLVNTVKPGSIVDIVIKEDTNTNPLQWRSTRIELMPLAIPTIDEAEARETESVGSLSGGKANYISVDGRYFWKETEAYLVIGTTEHACGVSYSNRQSIGVKTPDLQGMVSRNDTVTLCIRNFGPSGTGATEDFTIEDPVSPSISGVVGNLPPNGRQRVTFDVSNFISSSELFIVYDSVETELLSPDQVGPGQISVYMPDMGATSGESCSFVVRDAIETSGGSSVGAIFGTYTSPSVDKLSTYDVDADGETLRVYGVGLTRDWSRAFVEVSGVEYACTIQTYDLGLKVEVTTPDLSGVVTPPTPAILRFRHFDDTVTGGEEIAITLE